MQECCWRPRLLERGFSYTKKRRTSTITTHKQAGPLFTNKHNRYSNLWIHFLQCVGSSSLLVVESVQEVYTQRCRNLQLTAGPPPYFMQAHVYIQFNYAIKKDLSIQCLAIRVTQDNYFWVSAKFGSLQYLRHEHTNTTMEFLVKKH